MNVQKLLLASLLASSALVAHAQDVPAPEMVDLKKVCEENKGQNQADLVSIRAARPDAQAMRALLMAALERVPGNNICLAELLTDGDEDIAEMLAESASSGEIEPAAGPEAGGDTADFTAPATPAGENPSQLNQPVETPAASPSAPVATPVNPDLPPVPSLPIFVGLPQ